MTTSQKVIGGIAILGVILGSLSLYLGKPTTQSVQSFGNTSIDGSQSNLPNPSNSDYAVARLAFGYGTNLSNSNTGAGNINVEGQRASIVASTTVLCAIQNPFNATSTIVNAEFFPTTGTSSALTLVVGTSTNAISTSSSMMSQTYAAGSSGYPSTWDPSVNNSAIPPLDWVVFGVGGGSAVSYAYTYIGSCTALFQSL